jgi:hypothetical protein
VRTFDGTAGFQFATVADGQAPDGQPILSTERGTVTDPIRRERILQYLCGGATVVRDASVSGPDQLDPARPPAVPRGYRTDGRWIWPDALGYYLDRYGVAPAPEFATVIRERGFYCPTVSAARVGEARDALRGRAPGPLEPLSPPQSRFPADVFDVLVTYGWAPERDATAQADAWLDGLGPGEWGRPERVPARQTARRLLAEFGGLSYPIYGRGRDRPVVGFQFQPGGDPPDAARLTAAEAGVGAPVFPVGTVLDWRADLVVDASGRVFAVGGVDLYLGVTIDEALTTLVRGGAAQRSARVGS